MSIPVAMRGDKLAVESATFSVLKALAVFAFWAEITRLPGHGSEPFNFATAQTRPLESTRVAHIGKPIPEAPGTATASAACKSAKVGKLAQVTPERSAAKAETEKVAETASSKAAEKFLFILNLPIVIWRRRKKQL